MKVAIIGSRMYENTRKIKDTLFQLKQKFGDDLIIVSGGAKDGADKFARKYTLEFGIKYKEFNPAHTTKNLYSAMSDNYYNIHFMGCKLISSHTFSLKILIHFLCFLFPNF